MLGSVNHYGAYHEVCQKNDIGLGIGYTNIRELTELFWASLASEIWTTQVLALARPLTNRQRLSCAYFQSVHNQLCTSNIR